MMGFRLYPALAAIAGVLAILVGLYFLGSHNSLKAERARMAPVVQSYKDRISALLIQLEKADDKIDEANAKVDALKAEADAREKSAAAALKVARTQADRYRLRASQIAAAKPTGDQCEAARTLIVETLSGERR